MAAGWYRRIYPTWRASLPSRSLRRLGHDLHDASDDAAARAASWLATVSGGPACVLCGGHENVLDVAGYALCRHCRLGTATVDWDEGKGPGGGQTAARPAAAPPDAEDEDEQQ